MVDGLEKRAHKGYGVYRGIDSVAWQCTRQHEQSWLTYVLAPALPQE
jgi:hypothetical protein